MKDTSTTETWKGFERLAERILAELQAHVEVKWNDRIYGHDSETYRQIDVSIRSEVDAGPILVIVQAKDWNTPADLGVIDEFAAVVQDVRATKGILICRAGFSAAAKTYARNRGIALCNLHDAESRKWRLDIKIPILWIDLHPLVSFELQAHLEGGDTLLTDRGGAYGVSADGGISTVRILEGFEAAWNDGRLPRTVGAEHRVSSDKPGPFSVLVEDASGKDIWRPIDRWQLRYTVNRRAWLGYLTPDECRGLVDYLDDGAFLASYLPIGQIPTERDERWAEIEDPGLLAIDLKGTLVTTEGWQVVPGSGRFGGHNLRRISD